jgi:hypothetical protein
MDVANKFESCQLLEIAPGDFLQANARRLELRSPAVNEQESVYAFTARHKNDAVPGHAGCSVGSGLLVDPDQAIGGTSAGIVVGLINAPDESGDRFGFA